MFSYCFGSSFDVVINPFFTTDRGAENPTGPKLPDFYSI